MRMVNWRTTVVVAGALGGGAALLLTEGDARESGLGIPGPELGLRLAWLASCGLLVGSVALYDARWRFERSARSYWSVVAVSTGGLVLAGGSARLYGAPTSHAAAASVLAMDTALCAAWLVILVRAVHGGARVGGRSGAPRIAPAALGLFFGVAAIGAQGLAAHVQGPFAFPRTVLVARLGIVVVALLAALAIERSPDLGQSTQRRLQTGCLLGGVSLTIVPADPGGAGSAGTASLTLGVLCLALLCREAIAQSRTRARRRREDPSRTPQQPVGAELPAEATTTAPESPAVAP